jgi:plasmid stabilization system protein ParE
MAFRVEISPRAFDDLDEIARPIKQQASFEQAEEWFNRIIAAIRTLEDLPHRCRLADESQELGQEVCLLLYGRRNRQYKVYYSVHQTTRLRGIVHVFHVGRWARKTPNTDRLRELMRDPTRSANCVSPKQETQNLARWKGRCRKSFKELGYTRVGEFIEKVRGRVKGKLLRVKGKV